MITGAAAMLQNIGPRISYCLHKAAHARATAERALDAATRRYFLDFEESWLLPGRSEEFTERTRRFCMYLNAPAARPAWADPSRSANRTRGVAKRIGNAEMAVIDDSTDAREGLHALILSLGYKCKAFESAEDFLRSGSKADTACLILDVHLPRMSGPDLQAHLIASGYFIPIVFVSGRFEERIRSQVLAAGALAYLTKPYDESALLACLEKALRARG
jgi:CheY-like chemotaxis protein